MHKRPSLWRLVAVFLALGLVAAACGDDDDDGTTADTEAAGDEGDEGGAPSGEPIKIGLISQLEAPTFAFPEIETSAQAVIDKTNDEGGVSGRPLELVVCNDREDANEAANCAREMVSEDVVAVLGTFSLFGGSSLPILEAANIPYAGNTTLSPEDTSAPNAFPLEGGVVTSFGGAGVLMAQEGCTRGGAVSLDNAASVLSTDWITNGMEYEGAEVASVARVSGGGQPDYAPSVATVLGDGAECIGAVLPPAEAAKLAGAVAQSGEQVPIGASTAVFPQQVRDALGPAAEGLLLVTGVHEPTDTDVPAVQEMLDTIEQYQPDAPPATPYTSRGYAGAQFVVHALNSVDGDITAQSVFDVMENLTDSGTELIGGYDGTDKFDIEGLNRLANADVLFYKVENGELTLVSDEFVSLRPLLEEVTG